ncbi:DUF4352 domain-containing protein [Alicyclobacillus sendaiensis]|uniref:DUF4352 domain-containing protein n=1 Tax=Alicyclobacillus sendaiensis TaxID=192387 RepID=UPI0012EDAAC3|nr:DUF4352 domain-containing protein [Alicyclobacillus sendaiensis]
MKVLGWILVPYIMLFIQWGRMNRILRFAGSLWALIIFANTVYVIRGNTSRSSSTVSATTSLVNSTNSSQVAKQEQNSSTPPVHKTTNSLQHAQYQATTTSSSQSKLRYIPFQTFGKAGDLEIRVNSLQQVKSVGYDGMGETANGAFWVINVTIKNDGSTPMGIVDGLFHLQDLNGNVYQPDSTAEIYANTNSGTIPTDLNPGVSMTTNLVFDMPDFMTYGHIGQHYSLVASMGFFGSDETTYALP